eukprot:49228-Eustigmatos_ZCMA.PRE.1
MSDMEGTNVTEPKPKRVLSEAQRASFLKAQAKRRENIANRAAAKEAAHREELKQRKEKRVRIKQAV